MSRVIVERKNGVISLTESCEHVMNSFASALLAMKLPEYDSISRDLKVRLRADSSGNLELELLTDWAFLPSKTAPSSQ
jgi:hypothetical protein